MGQKHTVTVKNTQRETYVLLEHVCARLYDGGGKLYINDMGLEWVDFVERFFIWKSAVVDRVHSWSQSQISLQMEAVPSDFLFETLLLAIDNFFSFLLCHS